MRYIVNKYASEDKSDAKAYKKDDPRAYKNSSRGKDKGFLVVGPEIQQFDSLDEAKQSAGNDENLLRFVNEAWEGESLTFLTKTTPPENLSDADAAAWLKAENSKRTIASLFVEKASAASAIAKNDQILDLLKRFQSGAVTQDEYIAESARIMGM
jgi:hypothetical protein